MAGYLQGIVSVGTTATKILTVPAENDGVLINNGGSAAVILGGSTVTATGATGGISVASGATITVPTLGGVTHDLYGITASGTASVAYIAPSG